MGEAAGTKKRTKLTSEELKRLIATGYNTSDTSFAFISRGLRRIAVNPGDRRAQTHLLRHGPRYFSKVQEIIITLNEIFQPDVFLDVGSNYGECLFSLPLNSKIKALGFEANPQLIPYLERSRVYNDDVAVELICKAVGSNRGGGSISFFINQDWSGKSTAASGAVSAGMKEIVVPITTVDEEIESRFPEAKSIVMKVDVEGFEPQVIAGAAALIQRSELFVCLLEFDNQYIDGGDAGARSFFDELGTMFTIYHAGMRVKQAADYDSLYELLGKEGGRIHCDLLLVKSSEENHKLLRDSLCNRNLQRPMKKA